MAAKRIITTTNAPKPPSNLYSQGIVCNGMVYCSGAVGLDPETGNLVEGDIGARTHRCLKNLAAILEAAGSSLENVVKVNIYLTSMDNYAAMNSVYLEYWPGEKPCRTCVAVKALPRGTDVEIECAAALS